MRLAPLAALLAFLVGCGSSTPPDGSAKSGLQYDGSMLLPPGATQTTELSAPLFPDATVFQQFQNPNTYPSTSSADRLALVDDHVQVFEDLLNACADSHPAIKLRDDDDPPLTAAENETNYEEVAKCAYDDYGAKPYWVPQHVDDVDICARKLGADWTLPTEADVAAWHESDFTFFQDTMSVPQSEGFAVYVYYSLDIYVRANDGGLALGNLAPQTTHVVPLPVSGDDLNVLYVGNGRPIGLRCVRKTILAD